MKVGIIIHFKERMQQIIELSPRHSSKNQEGSNDILLVYNQQILLKLKEEQKCNKICKKNHLAICPLYKKTFQK
jgi:hypothetical protein